MEIAFEQEEERLTRKRNDITIRSGLIFPVEKIHQSFKENFSEYHHIDLSASIFLSAVMEYLTSEILQIAGNVAKECDTNIIQEKCIDVAIKGDSDLERLFSDDENTRINIENCEMNEEDKDVSVRNENFEILENNFS